MPQYPKFLRRDYLVISRQPSLRQLPGLSRVWRSRNTCWSSAKLPRAGEEESGQFAPFGASAGPAAYGAFSTQHEADSRATTSKSTTLRPLGYFPATVAKATPWPQQTAAQP